MFLFKYFLVVVHFNLPLILSESKVSKKFIIFILIPLFLNSYKKCNTGRKMAKKAPGVTAGRCESPWETVVTLR